MQGYDTHISLVLVILDEITNIGRQLGVAFQIKNQCLCVKQVSHHAGVQVVLNAFSLYIILPFRIPYSLAIGFFFFFFLPALAAVHSLIVIALSFYAAKIQLFFNVRQIPQNFMAILLPRVRDWSTLSQREWCFKIFNTKRGDQRKPPFWSEN